MNITIKGTEYELDLGIGFALALDSQYKFKQPVGAFIEVEFGLGVQVIYGQLSGLSIQAIVDFFNAGLVDVKKKSYSAKDLQNAIQEKAIELGGFDALANECIEAMKDVGLYQHIFDIEETPID